MSISSPDKYQFIVADASESFSLMTYDMNKMRFDTIAADLGLRSLYTGRNI